MKIYYPFFFLLSSVALLAGQMVAPTTTAAPDDFTEGKSLPALEKAQKIMAQSTVKRGVNTMVYRRVSAPSAKPVKSEAQVVAVAAKISRENVEAQASEEAELARTTYLSLSTVVRPRGVTEINWADDSGASKRVLVNGRLRHLAASLNLEFPVSSYAYAFMHWDESGESEEAALNQMPRSLLGGLLKASGLPRWEYVQVAMEDGALVPLVEREAEALDTLLAYYAVNETKIAESYAAAVAEAERLSEVKRRQDATPKTYEIRIWNSSPSL
jgi:hypothetical protein